MCIKHSAEETERERKEKEKQQLSIMNYLKKIRDIQDEDELRNIVVFRKGGGGGGYLGARERWVYDDCMMKVVNSYKYLGIYFLQGLVFTMLAKIW